MIPESSQGREVYRRNHLSLISPESSRVKGKPEMQPESDDAENDDQTKFQPVDPNSARTALTGRGWPGLRLRCWNTFHIRPATPTHKVRQHTGLKRYRPAHSARVLL